MGDAGGDGVGGDGGDPCTACQQAVCACGVWCRR